MSFDGQNGFVSGKYLNDADPKGLGWPRAFTTDSGATITLYQPQINAWKDFTDRAVALTHALDALGASYLLDWAGAALWIGAPADCAVRTAVKASGGHAMLVRAPEDRRTLIPVRDSEGAAVAALAARVKQAFDPAGILDPNRFS